MDYVVVASAVVRDDKLRKAALTLASMGVDSIFSFDPELETTAVEMSVSVSTALRRIVSDELNDYPDVDRVFDEEIGHSYMIEIAEMLEKAKKEGFGHVEIVYPWNKNQGE